MNISDFSEIVVPLPLDAVFEDGDALLLHPVTVRVIRTTRARSVRTEVGRRRNRLMISGSSRRDASV
jgi:hypothetical protein